MALKSKRDYAAVDYESQITGDLVSRRNGYHGVHSGSSGGYGHGFGYGKIGCCELVVDPLTYIALIGGIVFGTAFLHVAITMNIPPAVPTRRGRSVPLSISFGSVIHEGNLPISFLSVRQMIFLHFTYGSKLSVHHFALALKCLRKSLWKLITSLFSLSCITVACLRGIKLSQMERDIFLSVGNCLVF